MWTQTTDKNSSQIEWYTVDDKHILIKNYLHKKNLSNPNNNEACPYTCYCFSIIEKTNAMSDVQNF